jgi:hypothetical protein
MSKKVGLYVRVSTGNQISGLESQVRALRDYCTRNSITDYVIYEDENQSGTKHSRPALDRMMIRIWLTSFPESKLATPLRQSFLLAKMFLFSEWSVQLFQMNPLSHQMYASKERR